MRALRIPALVLVAMTAGLLGSAAAGAAPATAALVEAAARVLPSGSHPGDTVPVRASILRVAAPPVPAVAALVADTPCRATARACIELSSNRAWLISDGQVHYGPVPITHGRAGYRTPPGTFRVAFRNRDHVSSIYDAPMPFSVFFNGGIAFHEGSLSVTSHGCIHLSWTAARTFFAFLSLGDVVQVVR
jgi:hypothetical protein